MTTTATAAGALTENLGAAHRAMKHDDVSYPFKARLPTGIPQCGYAETGSTALSDFVRGSHG